MMLGEVCKELSEELQAFVFIRRTSCVNKALVAVLGDDWLRQFLQVAFHQVGYCVGLIKIQVQFVQIWIRCKGERII